MGMESCSFVSQWGQVRCPLCRLWCGSSSGVQSLCATPPESILEVLKFTTRQGENACWREEAGLAAEAALSPSWLKGAPASIVCVLCSSASRSGVSARGCWVRPRAHEGGCRERELPSAHPPLLSFGGGLPAPKILPTPAAVQGKEEGRAGEETRSWTAAILAGATRVRAFSSQVSVLIQGYEVGLTAHQGGYVGGEMPSAHPLPPQGWHLPPEPPVPSSACCCRHRCYP